MSLWATLPTLTSLVDFTTMTTTGVSYLNGEVLNLYFTNQLAVQWWVYTGILMALVMSFTSAAYVIVKTVDAGVSFTTPFVEGYAAVYRGGSVSWGDNLGLYELIALLAFSLWSLIMTIVALEGAYQLWNLVEEREVGVTEEGSGGVAFDDVQALKFFTLTMIAGFMALVGGFALGDTANELITWFDQYADDTKTEGTDKTNGDRDPDGTSAQYDIIYHYVTLAMGYAVFTTITLGGYIFGFEFLKYTNDITCDFDAVDSATVQEVRNLLGQVTSIDQCYTVLPQIMVKLDVNNNQMLDRCEDATLLFKIIGNTEEYAKKYSHHVPFGLAKNRCDQLFNPLYGL